MVMSMSEPKRQPRERDETFTGKFTHRWVDATKPKEREVQYAERLKKGLSLMLYVSPKPHGTKTWRALFYEKGKPRSRKLGTFPKLTVAKARQEAEEFDPEKAIAATKAGTFKDVAEEWLVRHVDKQGLRTKYEIERQLKKYVYPRWQSKSIFEISRKDVNDLLDKIEDTVRVEREKRDRKKGRTKGGSDRTKMPGAPMADYVLTTIRSIMTWYALQNDKYNSPLVPRMKRDTRKPDQKKRRRTLDHDEVRAVWEACEELGDYGALTRMLLLTAQRLRKVSEMRWDDIVDGVRFKDEQHRQQVADNVWVIRTEDGEKGNAGALQLPQMALDILAKLPRIEDSPYVFPAARGNGTIRSFSRRKKDLNKALHKKLPNMHPWVLHDLRRTARTLMPEIGIPDNIAERALGHAIAGVEGTYNRYSYFRQKSEALQKLAAHVDRIVNPPDGTNVVPLRPQAGSATA